jgi:hypothetical protein
MFYAIAAFFLHPFDSLPIMNFGVYRPIWLLPCVLGGVVYFRNIVRVPILVLGLVLLYGLLVAAINSLLIIDSVVVALGVILGVVTFFGAIDYIEVRRGDSQKELSRYLFFTSFVPLAVGVVFLLSHEIGSTLESMFSHRVYYTRMQMVSGEPSWAAKYTLLWIVAAQYVFNRSLLRAGVTISLIFMLLMTGSSLGILLGAFFLLYKARGRAIIPSIFLLSTIALLATIYGDLIFTEYTTNRLGNVLGFIASPGEFLEQTGDRSMLIRMLSPFVGIVMFVDSYGLGFGLGSTDVLYDEYAAKILSFFGVNMDYYYFLEGGSSAKNIYSKLIGELGFVGVAGLFFLVKRFFRLPSGFYRDFCFAVFLLGMNSDGYVYFPFILAVSILFHHNRFER